MRLHHKTAWTTQPETCCRGLAALPSAMVMSMVSVNGVADAGFVTDPPLIGDAVRPLKIRHSPSTATRNAAPTSFSRNLADIQDRNDLLQVVRFHLKASRTSRTLECVVRRRVMRQAEGLAT
jgi:hypothetical protein